MAQGDCISGHFFGSGNWDVIPPVGEVWLITYLHSSNPSYAQAYLTDGTTTTRIAGYEDYNLKLFINNSLWLYVAITNPSDELQWSGVQFK